MNKIVTLMISSLLLVSTAACENSAKTSNDSPGTVQESSKSPDVKSSDDSKKDAQSELRKKQLNGDIKAREERSNVTGGDTDRATGDLKSEVRSKLEANIPGSQLTINADKQGAVVISGTVSNTANKAKIDGLAKQIKGVKTVNSEKVVVAPATKK